MPVLSLRGAALGLRDGPTLLCLLAALALLPPAPRGGFAFAAGTRGRRGPNQLRGGLLHDSPGWASHRLLLLDLLLLNKLLLLLLDLHLLLLDLLLLLLDLLLLLHLLRWKV